MQLAEFEIPKTIVSHDNKAITFNKNELTIFGWIDAQKEPTKHTLKDIGAISSVFNNTKVRILLAENSENVGNNLISTYNLPESTILYNDINLKLLKSFRSDNVDLPLFIVVMENKVYYISEGYQVGIGEQLIKAIKKLEK